MPVQYWCFARALALLIACSATAYAEKRVALVIGNANYSALSTLTGPVNDAADVEQALRGLGYEIVPPPPGKRQSVDLTEPEMWMQLDALAKAARDAKLVLLFYAGHGFEMQGVNYLLPVDVAGSDSASVKSDGLNLDMVLNTVQAALPEGSSAVVVLDACRSSARGGGGGRGMVSIPKRPSFYVAFATEEDKVADDLGPNRRNSPYTQAFLEQIKADAKLPLSNFFIRVNNRVEAIANQSPSNRSDLKDDMIGLAPGAVLPTAAPSPQFVAPPAPLPTPAVRQPGDVYVDRLKDGSAGPEMVVLPAGRLVLGSPESEPGRAGDEGPQRELQMGSENSAIEHSIAEAAMGPQVEKEKAHSKPPTESGQRLLTQHTLSISDLTWRRSDNGKDSNLKNGLAYCRAFGHGWRLPTSAEARSIYSEDSKYAFDPKGGYIWIVKPSQADFKLTGTFLLTSDAAKRGMVILFNMATGETREYFAASSYDMRALCVCSTCG